MKKTPPWATRHVLARRALLALAVLTTAAAAVAVGFAAILFIDGHHAGNDPEATQLAFGLSYVILGVAGLPLMAVSAACWAGYRSAAVKARQLPR
jgi:hypothetical protein